MAGWKMQGLVEQGLDFGEAFNQSGIEMVRASKVCQLICTHIDHLFNFHYPVSVNFNFSKNMPSEYKA